MNLLTTFWDWGIIFPRRFENAQVWINHNSYILPVKTLDRNDIHILGLGLKIPPDFWDWVITEILAVHTPI